ncbi:MAG TPA: hypothetical protein VI585_05950 [Candidatus Binatia bacterium]
MQRLPTIFLFRVVGGVVRILVGQALSEVVGSWRNRGTGDLTTHRVFNFSASRIHPKERVEL